MNTPSAHSFARLRNAMMALAAWLDVPSAGPVRSPVHPSGPPPPGPDGLEALRALCAAGLRNIASHAEEYDRLIVRPNAFAAHFAATVAMLAPTAALADAARPGSRPADEQLGDAAFMLVEDMAALFRERRLRAPEAAPRDAEQALLDHFERCGEWLPADGTTITDWYYVRLPALVLAQLLRRVEAARDGRTPEGN